MSEENKEKNNKKTLSLKLGAKPSIPPLKSFESGKTVIVEKKRLRKSSSSQLQNNNDELNQARKKETTHTTDSAIEENSKKSGVVLKPLSKDEQKKILKADSKEEKNVRKFNKILHQR